MPRDHLLLHPQRVPVTPLDASTLLLLRDLPDGGCEVLMTRRSERASFAPGMYVFPAAVSRPRTHRPATM
jgi:recombination protein RecT